MPVYEYECSACGHRFERKQGFHEEPVRDCPYCQGSCRRILYAPPIIFKGSGFYVTDNRQAEHPEVATASTKAGPNTEAKTETKAEIETKAKAETKRNEGAPTASN